MSYFEKMGKCVGGLAPGKGDVPMTPQPQNFEPFNDPGRNDSTCRSKVILLSMGVGQYKYDKVARAQKGAN